MPNTSKSAPVHVGCVLKQLPPERRVEAAMHAIAHNEANRPDSHIVAAMAPMLAPGRASGPEFIAVMTSKYWGANGVHLTVGFLDNPPNDLRAKILSHMNAWGKTANVAFREDDASRDTADVRIARAKDGYWSYLGTDIKLIGQGKPTMNLQEFTMQTPDSEFYRVVRHETGHTLGCPHEHLRKALVARIDEAKAIVYFGKNDGWTPDQVRAQVLTPIDPALLTGTAEDQQSIMCYQIPGSITKDGKPIVGGLDIDKSDYDFMAMMYPKPKAPAVGQAAVSTDACADLEQSLYEIQRGDVRVLVHQQLQAETLRDLVQALG